MILVAATAIVLAVLRGDALDRASGHLENLAAVMSEQIRQSVQSVDLIVNATVKDLEGRSDGPPRPSDRTLRASMRDRVEALPHVRSLLFIDRDGVIRINSQDRRGPVAGVSDREYFRVHRDGRTAALHMAEPVVSRITGEAVQVFSRRVEDATGEFRGVVVATVRTPYFDAIFEKLALGADGRVLLFREDGMLLLTYPGTDGAAGRSFAQDALFTKDLPAAPRGVIRRTALLDETPRVLAFEHVRNYPLVVAVSSTRESILAPWRRDAWSIGLGTAGTIAFVMAALFFLMRQFGVSAVLQHDLDEASDRLQSIIQSAMDAVITVDEKQDIVLFNAEAERIFRCPASRALGGPLDRFIPERFRAAHHGHVERFGRTGATTRMMGARLDLWGLRADGEEFPIDASISQVVSDGRRFYTVILRDITERKAAEVALRRSYDELRELSAAMHDVREAERLRIARELHDELAQWLTALKMDVSWLSSRLPRDQAPLVDKTEKMKGLVDNTVAAVRRIAADLRPVMLDDLGLVPALEHLLHDLSQRTGIVVSLDADPAVPDFREPLPTALYRIAQEALTNVARHSEASEVKVAIHYDGDGLVLTVRDNGRGFDPERAMSGKSYGILGIRERAHTLGGDARIERAAPSGTLVEVTVLVARYRKQEMADGESTAG